MKKKAFSTKLKAVSANLIAFGISSFLIGCGMAIASSTIW